MRLASWAANVPVLLAGTVFLLAWGLPAPQHVEAKTYHETIENEGDPGDGFEGGRGGGGTIVIPDDQDQYGAGDEPGVSPSFTSQLNWFDRSLVLFGFVPRFDGRTIVWTVSFQDAPERGGGR